MSIGAINLRIAQIGIGLGGKENGEEAMGLVDVTQGTPSRLWNPDDEANPSGGSHNTE